MKLFSLKNPLFSCISLSVLMASCGTPTDTSEQASSDSSSVATQDTVTLTIEERQKGFCSTQSVPVESEHTGFQGEGYANSPNAANTGIAWEIRAESAGWRTIAVRFANGGNNARPGHLLLNNDPESSQIFEFTATGTWNDWQQESIDVYLTQGTHRLNLISSTADGLANIDSITLQGPSVQGSDCAETPPPESDGTTLAFPGAQGFGRFAVGGRYGQVVHVTNLNDSGPGSLREAISQPNRIVVFDVSGVIHLQSRLVFKSNQTIAGQTAPGDGITLYGDGTSFSSANNTIVRYIRFRMGVGGSSGKDTVGMADGHDVIWDHCSLSWGRDGTLDLNQKSGEELYNITLQDSIVSQGLQTHSTGGLVNTQGTSIIRSLYIDNNSRNPKARGTLQFVNNVIYNWVVSGYILGDTSGRSDGQMLGNYLIAGPETRGGTLNSPTPAYNLFANDNWYDSNKDGVLNGRLLTQGDFGTVTWLDSPSVDFPEVTPLSANDALNHVINHAGASLHRDPVDQYLIDELISWGTRGKTISDETELGLPQTLGNLANGTPPLDSDRDGMPDDWELANQFNPNDAGDAMLDADGDGWVNIEEYINELTDPNAGH